MSEELITKKQLLDLTGISYGQLYRWKRKGIIPEQWFIKKSSFTGQETFFEKDKILERIDKIMELKDNTSLDELADMFSINPAAKMYTRESIVSSGILTDGFIDLYNRSFGNRETFKFKDLMCMYMFKMMIKKNDIEFNDIEDIIRRFYDKYDSLQDKDYDLIVLGKEETTVTIISEKSSCYVLDNSKVIFDVNIHKIASQIKKEIM